MDLSIGSKIKALRNRQKLSQQDLCSGILDRTVLSKIENDKVTPSIFQIKSIAARLNIPVEFLLSGDASMNQDLYSYGTDLYRLFKEGHYYKIINMYEDHYLDDINDVNKYYYIGQAFFNCEYYDTSSKILKKYVFLYSKSTEDFKKEYVENSANAFNILCKIMFRNSNLTKCISYLNKARVYLELYERCNVKIYFTVMNNLGSIYCMLNQYTKTIFILENFLQKVKDLSFINTLPSMHLSLNISYYNLENYEKSIEHIKKAIFLFNYSGRHYDAAHSYLNYINALRYSLKFEEAFEVFEEYKRSYSEISSLYFNFLIQEMVLCFNVEKYELFEELSLKLKLNQLDKYNRCCYYFMEGHIRFIKKDYNNARRLFLKCEKCFMNQRFHQDLAVMYHDLYVMTCDDKYDELSRYYMNVKGKKNITVEIAFDSV